MEKVKNVIRELNIISDTKYSILQCLNNVDMMCSPLMIGFNIGKAQQMIYNLYIDKYINYDMYNLLNDALFDYMGELIHNNYKNV